MEEMSREKRLTTRPGIGIEFSPSIRMRLTDGIGVEEENGRTKERVEHLIVQ